MEKEARKYRTALRELTRSTASFIAAMDKIMKEPSTPERGQKIAKALNWIQMQNDSALHFTLGYSWPTIKRLYKPRKAE